VSPLPGRFPAVLGDSVFPVRRDREPIPIRPVDCVMKPWPLEEVRAEEGRLGTSVAGAARSDSREGANGVLPTSCLLSLKVPVDRGPSRPRAAWRGNPG